MRYAATATACLLLSAGAATATTLNFSYSRQNGSVKSSWTQPRTPTVLFSIPGAYTVVAVADGLEDVNDVLTPIKNVLFSPMSNFDGQFSGYGVGDFGLGVLYQGPESAPVFSSGTFTGVLGGTLTVRDALPGAAEPSTWFIMLVGLAIVGGAARAGRRRHGFGSHSPNGNSPVVTRSLRSPDFCFRDFLQGFYQRLRRIRFSYLRVKFSR